MNISYKVVIGFRGGPHANAGQFRDQLQFLSDSINAIILCPENSSHFNNQEELAKQLFEYSIDELRSEYNIDDDYIYLTGLSYGGRHALIASLDTDVGPLASIRGLIPFATGKGGHLVPSYEEAVEFPPVCICIGLNDQTVFQDVSQSIHQSIQENNGNSLLNQIPGVGHTVDFPSYPEEIMKCIDYIESVHRIETGINEILDLDNKWTAFPNPSRSNITLYIAPTIEVLSLKLISPDGAVVKMLDINERQIEAEHLRSHDLYIRMETKEGISIKKILNFINP